MYNRPFAYQENNQYCSSGNAVYLQCLNGARSGPDPTNLYTGCQNVSSGSCYSSGVFTPNFQSVTRYTSPIANTTQSCSELQQIYTCVNGTRSG